MAGLLEEKALQDEVFGVESELIDGSDLEDLIASRVVSSDEDWLPLKPMKAKRSPKNAKGPVAAMKQGRVSEEEEEARGAHGPCSEGHEVKAIMKCASEKTCACAATLLSLPQMLPAGDRRRSSARRSSACRLSWGTTCSATLLSSP